MCKCSCYETKVEVNYTFHPITKRPIPNKRKVGICNGTKERDQCSCEGDMTRCDFYPEVRKRARDEIKIGTVKSLSTDWAVLTQACVTNEDYKQAIFNYLNIK